MAESRNLIVAHDNLLRVPAIAAASTTGQSIAEESKVFVLTSSAKFVRRMIARASRASDAETFVEGPVTAYDPVTRALEIDVTATGGSGGPYTDWVIQARKVWGGDWVENGSLSLANVIRPELFAVARSTDADPDSTEILVDLGGSVPLDVLAPLGLNAGLLGLARYRAIDVDPLTLAETLVYDSALVDLTPATQAFGDPDWGDPDLWFLRPGAAATLPHHHFLREQLVLESNSARTIGAGTIQFVTTGSTEGWSLGLRCTASSKADWKKSLAGDVLALGANTVDLRVERWEGAGTPDDWTIRALKPGGLRQGVTARLASLRFYDPANDQGYLQVAHLWASAARQLANNFSFGLGLGEVDRSLQDEAYGGQVYTTRRAGYRQVSFDLGFMQRAEALGFLAPLKRLIGVHSPALWIFDPGAQDYQAEEMIFGTLVGPLDPSVVWAKDRWRTAIRVREWR